MTFFDQHSPFHSKRRHLVQWVEPPPSHSLPGAPPVLHCSTPWVASTPRGTWRSNSESSVPRRDGATGLGLADYRETAYRARGVNLESHGVFSVLLMHQTLSRQRCAYRIWCSYRRSRGLRPQVSAIPSTSVPPTSSRRWTVRCDPIEESSVVVWRAQEELTTGEVFQPRIIICQLYI